MALQPARKRGSCHKCGGLFNGRKDLTAPPGHCPECLILYHTTDCGGRLALAGLDASRACLQTCPKCAGLCACAGGAIVCNAARQVAAKRMKNPATTAPPPPSAAARASTTAHTAEDVGESSSTPVSNPDSPTSSNPNPPSTHPALNPTDINSNAPPSTSTDPTSIKRDSPPSVYSNLTSITPNPSSSNPNPSSIVGPLRSVVRSDLNPSSSDGLPILDHPDEPWMYEVQASGHLHWSDSIRSLGHIDPDPGNIIPDLLSGMRGMHDKIKRLEAQNARLQAEIQSSRMRESQTTATLLQIATERLDPGGGASSAWPPQVHKLPGQPMVEMGELLSNPSTSRAAHAAPAPMPTPALLADPPGTSQWLGNGDVDSDSGVDTLFELSDAEMLQVLHDDAITASHTDDALLEALDRRQIKKQRTQAQAVCEEQQPRHLDVVPGLYHVVSHVMSAETNRYLLRIIRIGLVVFTLLILQLLCTGLTMANSGYDILDSDYRLIDVSNRTCAVLGFEGTSYKNMTYKEMTYKDKDLGGSNVSTTLWWKYPMFIDDKTPDSGGWRVKYGGEKIIAADSTQKIFAADYARDNADDADGGKYPGKDDANDSPTVYGHGQTAWSWPNSMPMAKQYGYKQYGVVDDDDDDDDHDDDYVDDNGDDGKYSGKDGADDFFRIPKGKDRHDWRHDIVNLLYISKSFQLLVTVCRILACFGVLCLSVKMARVGDGDYYRSFGWRGRRDRTDERMITVLKIAWNTSCLLCGFQVWDSMVKICNVGVVVVAYQAGQALNICLFGLSLVASSTVHELCHFLKS